MQELQEQLWASERGQPAQEAGACDLGVGHTCFCALLWVVSSWETPFQNLLCYEQSKKPTPERGSWRGVFHKFIPRYGGCVFPSQSQSLSDSFSSAARVDTFKSKGKFELSDLDMKFLGNFEYPCHV